MVNTAASCVRIRVNSRGEPELSASDLRASQNGDLIQLAEADRAESSFLGTRGNDDAWVSPAEVEGARGLHVAILGGYQRLLRLVERQQLETISPLKIERLIHRASKGPIKLGVRPPKAPPAKPDPIRRPKRFTPSEIPGASSPLFLKTEEAALEAAISSDPKLTPVYRGFALPAYGGPEMVRYLMGDWRCLVATHTFSKALRTALEGGAEFHAALRQTSEHLTREIRGQIEESGYRAFAIAQSRATQIGIHDKSATGMACYVASPLEGPTQTPTSFGYARSGFLGLIHDRRVPRQQPMIVVEVDQRVPSDYGSGEFHIPSHLPPSQVTRFFLGFSNWYNVRDYLRAPEQKERWFEVAILARDPEKRPADFEITPMEAHLDGTMEHWTWAKEAWRASEADTPSALAFEGRHRILRDTFAEIRRCLSG